ncbi:MAG: hypothetical protein N2C14_10145, partial [Planctomycetales bacterium]
SDEGPNTEDIHDLFKVRVENRLLMTEATRAYKDLAKSVKEALEMEGPQLKKINTAVPKIADGHKFYLQLSRLSLELVLVGEPAGFDMLLRAKRLRNQLEEVIRVMRRLHTQAIQIQQPTDGNATRLAQEQQLPKALKLLEAGKFEEADDEFHKIYEDVSRSSIWYEQQRVNTIMRGFNADHKKFNDQLTKVRREAGLKAIRDGINNPKTTTTALLTAVGKLKDEHVAGEAKLDGKPITGPALIGHIAEQWKEGRRILLKQWAMSHEIAIVDRNVNPILGDMKGAHAGFSQQCVALMAEVVKADAARVNEITAIQMYADYLKAFAPLVARTDDPEVFRPIKNVLGELVAKSPDLNAQVTAYSPIIDDLLRWRQRGAEDAGKAFERGYRDVGDLCFDKLKHEGGTFGFFLSRGGKRSEPAILENIPETLNQTKFKFRSLKGRMTRLFGSGREDGSLLATYRNRYYGVATPFQAGAEEQRRWLLNDLQVDPNNPPLTLNAAVAVHIANSGDAESLGGKITLYGVQGLLPAFSSLSAEGSSDLRMPYDFFPEEPEKLRLGKQLIVFFAIQPTWVQYRHFFLNEAAFPGAAR